LAEITDPHKFVRGNELGIRRQSGLYLLVREASPAQIKEGDAVPIQLGDVHSFENTGAEPLEFMMVGVARDLSKHVDSIDAGPGLGGRRGN
jgi:hypothetical protein